MSEQANLAIANKYFVEFLGKGNMNVAEDVFDPGIQVITGLKPTGPINGIAEYKAVFSGFFDAFPPIAELRIVDQFAAGERVVTRFHSRQRHAKDYYGIKASKREILFDETHVSRIRNGKIVENIVSATNLEFEMLMAPVLTPMILKE